MTSPLDRARQLVALAATPPAVGKPVDGGTPEQRSAAYQACKLIAEHKLLDVGGPVRARVVNFDGEQTGIDVEGLFRFMQDFFGPTRPQPRRRPEPPPPPPPPKPRRPPTYINQAEFRRRVEESYQEMRSLSPQSTEPVLRRAAAEWVRQTLATQGVEVLP